jgi:pyruvate formate-lyase activating enzyme-like uncharacterized protein
MRELPDFVVRACRQQHEGSQSNLNVHLAAWEDFLTRLRDQVPAVKVEDQGATVRLGGLSPGCVHCKQGQWECLFLTHRCNLACSFCCSPLRAHDSELVSVLGHTADQVIARSLDLDLLGISLSGGEPLLAPKQVYEWLKKLRRKLPDRYLWLYTNGVLLQPKVLDRLSDLGLDEIRFNAAATGYARPDILAIMAHASRRLRAVTVEIPAIPGDADRLVASLSAWAGAGVKYLNLHELVREPDSHSATLSGEFSDIRLSDGHVTHLSDASRELVLQVMRSVSELRISLQVNFCSLVNKLNQLRGRRRILARLVQQAHERRDGECLETVAACRSADDFSLVHPDRIEDHHRKGRRLFLIRRLAPLSPEDVGPVVAVREITT